MKNSKILKISIDNVNEMFLHYSMELNVANDIIQL